MCLVAAIQYLSGSLRVPGFVIFIVNNEGFDRMSTGLRTSIGGKTGN